MKMDAKEVRVPDLRKRKRKDGGFGAEHMKGSNLGESPAGDNRHKRHKETSATSTRCNKKAPAVLPKDLERGVIYLGHLPQGFFEPQIKSFFSQFGHVSRLIVPRSTKNGHVRGYAYVEFDLKEVAEIAAEAMNNYRVFGKSLVCKLLTNDEVLARGNIFRNWNKRFNSKIGHMRFMKSHNKDDDSLSSRQIQSRIAKCRKVVAKLKSLNFDSDYDITTLLRVKSRSDIAAQTGQKKEGEEKRILPSNLKPRRKSKSVEIV